MTMIRRCFLLFATIVVTTHAFSMHSRTALLPTTTTATTTSTATTATLSATARTTATIKKSNHIVASIALISTLITAPSLAFDPSDYASETVTQAIVELRNSQGKTADTFKAFEDVAAIITEGKGVGGAINYKGVQLDRGYISDEDTAIYNPGLTLLTESEKERLVEAVIESRKSGQTINTWDENNQVAFEFLKEKLDPLHMRELKGYLGILPIYAGVLYLGVLAVQQGVRDLFAPAYIGAAALIFLPIVVLVALGPQ